MAKRTIGPVTETAAVGSVVGSGTGVALAQIIVWVLYINGVDAKPIEVALSVILTGALGLLGTVLGGWSVAPSGKRAAHE